MADARPFAVYDAAGAPVTGAAAGMSALAWDVTGTPRTPPAVTELGGGLYQVEVTDADEAAGTLVLVTTGHTPARVSLACYLPSRANQFFGWHLEDAAGALWTGAPPTFGAWRDKAGTPRTAPAIVEASSGVYIAVPSAGDLDADCAGVIGAATGAAPAFLSAATLPVVSGGGPVVAPPDYAAGAVLALLEGTVSLPPPASGTVELTAGADGNLLLGPPRSTAAGVAQLAVFVLQSGGAAPAPYLGAGESFHESAVQVVVRSDAHDFATAEALARALLARIHLGEVAGFTFIHAVESEPNYIGSDDDGAHRWTINARVGHRR